MVKVKRFTATWCSPCKQLAPLFTQMEIELPNVVFETIDVDQDKEQTAEYFITSVPTVIIEQDGRAVQRYVGAQPKSMYVDTINSLI